MSIVTTGALTEDGTKFWLSSCEFNGLFYMDLRQGHTVTYKDAFHDYIENNAWMIRKVISFENKLYFFSRFSYEMWIMDCDKGSLQHDTYYNGMTAMVDDVVVWHEKACIISRMPLTILLMDLTNRTTTRLYCEKDFELKDNVCAFAAQKDEKIFVITRLENQAYLGIVDCEKQIASFSKLEQLSFAKCVGVIGESVFVLGVAKNNVPTLLKYDLFGKQLLESHELTVIKLEASTKIEYTQCVSYNNKLFFIPGVADKFALFDLKTNSESTIEFPEIIQNQNKLIFFDSQQMQNVLFLFPYGFEKILKIDLQNFEMETIEIVIPREEYRKAIAEYIQERGVIGESSDIKLDDFWRVIHRDNFLGLSDKSCGKEIYQKLLAN